MSILENVEGKQPRPRRSFTAEFKAEIVECCQRGDGSIGQVARDFDLTETAVREWVPQAEPDAGTRSDGLTSAERDEFAQLRRENRGCGRTSKFFGGHRQTTMKDHNARYRRRQKGLANWRLVRCADDWVAMIAGTRADAEQLRRDIADVLAPMGLRLSATSDLWGCAGTMSAVPEPFPKGFREDVVRVARVSDSPVARVAKDFRISESCLHRWLAHDDVEQGNRPGVTASESAELRGLRRCNTLLEPEKEVLRRAAAYVWQANLPGSQGN